MLRCAAASLSRRCASIRARMVLPPTGIWSTWAAAQSAVLRWFSRRLRPFCPKPGSALRTWASGKTSTSRCSRASLDLSPARGPFQEFNWRTRGARPAPTARGKSPVRFRKPTAVGRPWPRAPFRLAKQLGPLGVDLVDCSSGGLAPGAKIPIREGYQVPFSEAIRRATGVLTGAVGMITTAEHAEAILQEGKADVVLMARQFLRQPYWPLDAARALGVPFPWPVQYLRA